MSTFRRLCRAILPVLLLTTFSQSAEHRADPAALQPILHYISSAWDTLTRSMTNCDTIVDPKLVESSVLYLPADFPAPSQVQQLEQRCHVRVQKLPIVITQPGQAATLPLPAPGLLYLERPYVVPGGRFNEQYGWDSYFIVLGLLEDGRVDLARGMVENFFFEIQHYGTILNANRTYYLSRSQPPFLTSMIMAVYEAEKALGHEDRAWLEKAYGFASKDYELWIHDPHLAGTTGLSRYYDFGIGPAPESLKDEAGVHRKVANYFLLHPESRSYVVDSTGDSAPAIGFQFGVQICDVAITMARPECEAVRKISLSPDYYKGDRSMRESGFDISFRFGPYGAATHHYAPVCLNSLLYKTEKDLQQMADMLGHKDDAPKWAQRAEQRQQLVQRYLWDPVRRLYFDYNVSTGERSSYEYITTLYPLWAGLATNEQAEAVVHNLGILEQPGGLVMSTHDPGVQWDYPYGWAPTQIVAIKGLRRYGFNDDANRVSYKFISTIAENFRRDGTIREKYNLVTRSSESQIAAGYNQNVIGFGWTNAAFLIFLHDLPPAMVVQLAREQTEPPRN